MVWGNTGAWTASEEIVR
ncbi:hypothetical protein EYZ11_005982 [Aspergillus tanneri]|uniref:Uncharacterized protein n=1 Tax=Aspergillus tanneri TaxID=1220188 RepID=A0A4S3JMJ9_9EURO|nr:hypothetical protein EYZ11_005982 [Aspergillus tanneri]